MMRIRVEKVGAGLHPKETVVAVNTRDGREQLAVDSTAIYDETLSIGWPVGQSDEHYLVELPQETFRGFWRVWVPKLSVIPDHVTTEAKA